MKLHLSKNYWWLFGVALLPVLNDQSVGFTVFLFALFSIISYYKKNGTLYPAKTPNKIVFIYTGPFILYLISLLWTNDIPNGMVIIERVLSFLIIPIIVFYFVPFGRYDNINKLFRVYVYSTIVLTLLTFGYILNESFLNGVFVPTSNLRDLIQEVPFVGEHPIYFSLILAFGLLLLDDQRFKLKWVNWVIGILFVTGLIMASSRGVIIGVIIVVVIKIISQNISKRRVASLLGFLLVGCMVVIYLSPIKKRVLEITQNQYFYPEGVHYNSYNLRNAVYYCSFNRIIEAPLFGFGPGDVQKELNSCYTRFDTDVFVGFDYNSHNQYLSYLLSFGLLGFGFILYCFMKYVRISLKAGAGLYFNFLILCFVAMLFENILERNTGIVLFVMFNCILGFRALKKNVYNN